MALSVELHVPKISILVCGKTGVGKSSLINCLLGKDVCRVGDPMDYINEPEKAFWPSSLVVEEFNCVLNEMRVTIYDSPGLLGDADNDQQYLHEMYKKCRDVDLVLYCYDITCTRWTGSDTESLRLLTEKFGPTFWNKVVVVFTKANLMKPARSAVDEKEYLEKVSEMSGKRFRRALIGVFQSAGVSDDPWNIADNVPAVLAGSARQQILPTGPFIGNLWATCLKRLYPYKAEVPDRMKSQKK